MNQRLVDVTTRFDNLGDTTVTDAGASTGYRKLQWLVVAPFPEHEQARFQYDEYYEQDRGGWAMVKYAYDLLEVTRNSRLAFHSHQIREPTPTPHVHCEPEQGNPAHHHFRFFEMSIYEALEEHQKWWASDTDLDCGGLRPLLDE